MIVAKGKVHEKTGPLEKIHNIPLGEHNVRVSIDCVLCPDSPLPIPVRDVLTAILDAQNSFVAWPEKWVIVGDKDVVDESSATNGEVASQLQMFGKIIEKMMKSSQISIPLENGVFEEDIAFNYFFKFDLLDVCTMKKIEVNSITAYLRFLYDRYENS
ncbi:hypothetical protein IFM89_016108 [Coptis chinensis]|uniref:DUF8039 domain-containing protein n=1 Tax=Coptis chinensis TaxID=261450 RepID=A0A835HVZ2_9MAGN|nr:hypothetical protein IFM89_016108 [Coptis chinensis]